MIQEGLLIPATRYLEAKSMRGPLLRSHVEAVFGKVDALFAPVVPGPVVQEAPAAVGSAPAML